MEPQINKVKNIRIAYIGGGSRGWAWTFMTDLALEPQLAGEIRLYDIDHKASEINAVIGNDLKNDPRCQSDFHYVSVNSLQEALTGTDFVVISILPGTFEAFENDPNINHRLTREQIKDLADEMIENTNKYNCL